MKATILSGARPGDDFTDAVAAALHDRLSTAGWTVTSWILRDHKVAPCLGCFECWTKTPGLCRIDDAGRSVAADLIGSDLAVYLTPVTFGGYSSELKKAIDRSIGLISPFFRRIDGEVHHRPRYDRYPAMAAVGILPAPHPAQEQIFGTLLQREALNLHAPAHGSTIFYRSQEPTAAVAGLQDLLSQLSRRTA